MRFLIYGLFLTLWIVMWLWTYTCHIKAACCTEDSTHPASEILKAPEVNPELDGNQSLLTNHMPPHDNEALFMSDGNVVGLLNSNYNYGSLYCSAMCELLPVNEFDTKCIAMRTKIEKESYTSENVEVSGITRRTQELQFTKPQ